MYYIPAMTVRHPLCWLLSLFVCLALLFSPSLLGTKKKPPERPVNLNTATSEQLQQVPGIGPATAGKILQMRKTYGPFKSVDDLLAIRRLGAKRLGKMREHCWQTFQTGTAGPPATQPSPPEQKLML